MPCIRIDTPNGTVIACTRGAGPPKKCAVCKKPAKVLCDAPEDGKRCSKPLCFSHTTQVKRNGTVFDYCPEHKALAGARGA